MLSNLQTSLQPYLEYFSENDWIQALVIIFASCFIAWVFNRFIITILKKLAAKTTVDFDNQLIELLHKPIYSSVILLGLALAINTLHLGDSVEFLAFHF